MNAPTSSHDPGKVRADQAADWFLKMQDSATEDELRQWLEWCTADPENLREYERIRDTWRGFGVIKHEAVKLLPGQREYTRAKRFRLVAAAACTIMSLSGWWIYQSGVLTPNKRVLSSHRITNASATLPDGSALTLAPRTKLAVDFTGPTRSLDLSNGEVYFKVSPDKNRPFVVQAAGLRVMAIGTAFSVKSKARDVEVTVEEGMVEATNGAETWQVGAGSQITYDVVGRLARLAAIDTQRELAWRDGRLEYFMQPLDAVISDANRYSGKQIEIADPDIAKLTYTGTIFTRSIDDWLQAVESTFPLQVVTLEDHIVLRSRTP